MTRTTTTTPHVGHCPTCQCARDDTDHITVYPAIEKLYGRCDTCGHVRWSTERNHAVYSKDHGWRQRRAQHCGCCTHTHDLANGGHTVACSCPDAPKGAGQ